jgi:hypothetical protein
MMDGPLKSILKRVRGTRSREPEIVIPGALGSKPRRKLAIAAIVKDEARYLDEWIRFHLAIGVEHIFLYDNGSTDDTAEVIRPFVRDNLVTVIPWPHFDIERSTQCLAYAHAIAVNRGRYRWLACIDVDEFLFPVEAPSLPELLEDYQDVPALAVYWVIFGTSGHEEYQPRGVLDSYVLRQRIGNGPQGRTRTNFKSIVQPAQIEAVLSAHQFRSAQPTLDETRQPVLEDKFKAVSIDRVRINHYYTKSASEWRAKLARSGARALGYDKRQRRENVLQSYGPLDVEDRLIISVRDRLVGVGGTPLRR